MINFRSRHSQNSIGILNYNIFMIEYIFHGEYSVKLWLFWIEALDEIPYGPGNPNPIAQRQARNNIFLTSHFDNTYTCTLLPTQWLQGIDYFNH